MPHKNHLYKLPLPLVPNLLCLKFTLLAILLLRPAPAAVAADADLLLKFKSSLSNATALGDWNASVTLCEGSTNKWTGLTCVNGKFYGLRLENMGLGGSIDVDALAQVSGLRSLSVANNGFQGPIPQVRRLPGLRALYLSNNRFSGEISGDGFNGLKYLKKVYLDGNSFSGKLPISLVGLSKLVELYVEGNEFEGKIPEFQQLDWKNLSFANNRFTGRIPASLSKIDQSAFSGNKGLCGAPLGPCKSSKKRIITIAIIVSVAAAVLIIALIVFLRARRARAQTSQTKLGPGPPPTKIYKRFSVCDKAQSSDQFDNGDKRGSLHFVRDDKERFELEDLLRASAEVLGSGSFGSSYKAAILNGPALVVKRFRHMNNVSRGEFQAHMARLGRLDHPNLLPIVAYYYTKEEKLLVSNFVENGSLASHLHGKRPEGQPGLDWASRLNIIKGVSKGLSYLYSEFPDLILPHGHLKSSNVLIDRDLNPHLSEYALAPLISRDHAHRTMAAYKSPEFCHRERVAKKTDVWNLGILILELLTGKFPANYLTPGTRGTSDLAAWVNSVVREEWTGEVFDKEMKGTKRAEEQMLRLLKIGMCCSDNNVERRCDWQQATERIEELTERDNGAEDDHSSYVTDWDVYSSMILSDNDFSFSVKNV